MKKLLRLLVALPALLFVAMGLRWIIEPTEAAASLGMPLLTGLARSSQVGDVGGLLLAMGLMMFVALVTERRSWFFAPAMLLALAAILRTVAWFFHGAELAVEMITVEVIVASILLFASIGLSVKASE
ncbi:MAG: hypothetical protein ACSHWQ_05715 [Spongiibacteraceae bacterium]